MTVQIFKGKKQIKLRADKLPDIDDEQAEAGEAMADRRKVLLFSDPGAGKTLTAIHAMTIVVTEHKPDAKVLVVCPTIAVRTWARWIKTAYEELGMPARVQIAASRADKVHPDTTHLIATYGLFRVRKMPVIGMSVWARKFDIAILDESDNLAGPDSLQTQAIYGPNFQNGGLIRHCEWVWPLTGTPIPKHNDGLYPVLRCLFPEKLTGPLVSPDGTEYPGGALKRKDYEFVFCKTRLVKFGKMRYAKEQVFGSRNHLMLNEILFGGDKPICYRIKLKLGEFSEREVDINCKFSDEFVSAEQEVLEELGDDYIHVVSPKQATAFRLMGRDAAPDIAAYVVDELQKDRDRAVTLGKLVLYWHTEVGEIIADALSAAGYRVGLVSGRTTSDNDSAVEDLFNAGKLDVVVGQIKSMGVALNLQENCDHVIFAEETFSAASNLQALQRVWRRGQKRHVRVDRCLPYSELAERKPASAASKAKSAAKVLGDV